MMLDRTILTCNDRVMPVPTSRPLVEAFLRSEKDLELEGWVVDQRVDGKSWETIARDLYTLTEGIVEVSGATVRRWFLETVPA